MHQHQTERKAEHQVETLYKEIWKVWFKGGRRIGQDIVEERNTKPFRRPQMMGKAGEEKVEECDLLGPWNKESFPVEFERPLVSHRPDRSKTAHTWPET